MLPKAIFVTTVLLACTPLLRAAELVTDENTRLQVLSGLFPKLTIAEIKNKKIDNSFPVELIGFPDALKDEKTYDVEGAPMDKVEACAASFVVDPVDRIGRHRELRFKLFDIRAVSGESRYIAVLQYRFADAQPPASCESIGEAALLSNVESRWKIEDEFIPDTTHHTGWQTIRFADLKGNGAEELLLESDWGGNGGGSTFFVLDDGSKRLKLLVAVFSRAILYSENGKDEFNAILDTRRTVLSKGREFCFLKTTYASNGTEMRTPRVSHPCYPDGHSEGGQVAQQWRRDRSR